MEVTIKRADDSTTGIDDFINEEFTNFAKENEVALNYEDFTFAAYNESNEIIGVITGRAYYNEVHIGDLIVDKRYRRTGLGSKLVSTVENKYSNKGYDKITLTTFGFQAPEFYKKLGYELEFIRKDADPKLSKYFYSKPMDSSN